MFGLIIWELYEISEKPWKPKTSRFKRAHLKMSRYSTAIVGLSSQSGQKC